VKLDRSNPLSFTPQFAVSSIARFLWLIPAVPMVASGIDRATQAAKPQCRCELAIGSLGFSLLLSLIAFAHVLRGWTHGVVVRETVSFTWLQFGHSTVDLGWVLDPLAAIMLVMVSFVGLLIFIYSVGYMAHDENFTRFFCFLSLFAGAMLGVVISNSLLLLFMCWEIVGLTSYLLIGFWYQKPAAAAAAKKAFVTTRVGDVFFLLGIVWLFSQTGTLLFYNNGAGSLEHPALTNLLAQHAGLGLSAASAMACSSLPEPWVRAASFRCTCGCLTRWRAPRRSPRSFTRPPWSRPAFILSRVFIR
jgi:NADH-quinone oxidoreductase subunit L